KLNYTDYENEINTDLTDNTSASPAQQQLASNNESTLNEQGISNEEQSNQAVKSPMVGTFYLQDEKELTNPLIREGDEIKKGDTIGYIEAMKVMNEVKSDVDGVVDTIHVNHGSNVEYDQTIITVK